MNGLIAVMIGGAIGAGGRYGIGALLSGWVGTAFPWATLVVNLTGGFAMGLLAGLLARGGDTETMRLFFGVGVLGGFTTFSAFGLETVQLMARGHALPALAYVTVSVGGSVALTMLGVNLVRAA
jgi:fluoride exporter